MKYSLNTLYKSIGITKQAVHQQAIRQAEFEERLKVLVGEVDELRRGHPGCGLEKMYHTLTPDFLGRDRFIDVFMDLGYRVRQKKNYHRTTYSSGRHYRDLIQGMLISGPGQVWQSDITYFRIGEEFYYLVFIIDVYTKEIVGHAVSDHMRATANMVALKMALEHHGAPWIHHSDRGSQYTSTAYVTMLKDHGCRPSMGYIAQDNAYAERINRTIKEEYLDHWTLRNLKELKRNVAKAVKNYNTERQHDHIFRKTPQAFRAEMVASAPHNRPKATIYAEGQIKMEMAYSHSPFFAQQALRAPNCPMVNELNEVKTGQH